MRVCARAFVRTCVRVRECGRGSEFVCVSLCRQVRLASVYTPSMDEQRDAALYAANVRAFMMRYAAVQR